VISSDADSIPALLFKKAESNSEAVAPCGFTYCGSTVKTDGSTRCYWRRSMKTGDLVRRRNDGNIGQLAIVIETEWNPRCLKVNVLTLKGHKEYWYPADCEVVSESR
jgi:hypothetical protein